VVIYAPDVDLAILEIKGEQEKADFFHSSLSSRTNNGDDDVAAPTNGNENSNSNNNKHRRTLLALEFAPELPALQESVHVVGFPTGGRTICVTEGVVSRIDLHDRIVAIQIDAAINAGNSGGPAFNSKGQVTGVAFSKRVSSKSQKVDNIGYLIPAVLVRSFLGRCSNMSTNGSRGGGGVDDVAIGPTYTLSPCIPYRWHSLENNSLRLAHAVPDTVHGILLTSVCESAQDALQKNDVLTKIDDKDVADDGQVVMRGDELIQHAYLMRIKKVEEPVTFTVYRNGQHVTCPPFVLRDIPSIIPVWENVDFQPEYLILGALVLLPFSFSLRANKKCGPRLSADCMDWYERWPSEWENKQGLVLLTEIFAHELSFSYSRPWRRVVGYNGISIQSLAHLRELWEASRAAVVVVDNNGGSGMDTSDATTAKSATTTTAEAAPTFVRLELENDDDIVFEVKAAIKAQAELMAMHEIPRPSQIIPFNPSYKR
jgi:PDZ domain/Trypsin-like peptidase domain